MNSSNIIWKDIIGYNGDYQISNTGLVKSIGRNIEKIMYGGVKSVYFRPEKILKPGKLRGYYHITLRKNNTSRIFKIHRLVLQTFFPINNFEKLQVNHKDGIKDNNNVENLEWVTHQENQLHRYQNLYNDKKLSRYSYITKTDNKWRLRGFKNKHLGYFTSEEEALNKYNDLLENNPEVFNLF